ncbi:MAG: phosphonate ABC transporter substrate-binding protein [Prochlorotrichaceae cyanobacterium]
MSRQFQQKWFSLCSLAIVGVNLLASCASQTPTETASPAAGTSPAPEVASGEACAPEITELNFGIISTESQANQKPLWEPFIAAMSEQTGRQVNAFYATQYAGVIEAMGANKVQLAWYGGKSYVEAAKISDAEAFVRTIKDDGSKGYYAYLITNKENPILKEITRTPNPSNPLIVEGDGDKYVVANAANLTFAFNDPNSTSGFLVPSYYVFAQQGADANKIFKELIFAGSHEATALAVANNQVDVATNNNESLERLKETNADAAGKIEIIWTSPEIPSDPIAYRKDLPDCVKSELQNFFLNYKDEAVLKPLQWSGFESATDADWNTIRQLEIAKTMLEIQGNADLSEAEKKTQLDELNQELEALK